jgi:F0F1-type ATP synthase membrane subunit a
LLLEQLTPHLLLIVVSRLSDANKAHQRIAEQVLAPPIVASLHYFFDAYIPAMGRHFFPLLGTVGMLLVMLLWVSLLNPTRADHLVDSLAGPQHEYKIVLGAALLSVVFSFIAAIRGSKWWYLGVALSSGTLAFFTYSLSV